MEGMRMRFIIPSIIGVALLVAGCAGSGPSTPSSRAVVTGAGAELLKLRAGPGLGYNIILGLPDGTVLLRRGCTTELGQLWCRVALARAPGITGYVSADYLTNP